MKNIKELPQDILTFIDSGTISKEAAISLAKRLAKTIMSRAGAQKKSSKGHLRLSQIGYPDRRTWYSVNLHNETPLPSPQLRFTFLIGDILEDILLWAAAEAGHTVEDEQKKVVLEGVTGHIDAIIDGCLIDVKTASNTGFSKFSKAEILKGEDPFGYLQQLAAYSESLGIEKTGWLAFNKNNSEVCLLQADAEMDLPNATERILHLKEVVKLPEPPERCYKDTDEVRNKKLTGNRILCKECSFCPYKFKCWEGLRGFQYSWGTQYFTHIEEDKTPKVKEIFEE